MDLLAKKRMLFVLIAWLAQTLPLSAGEDIFHLSVVDYFALQKDAADVSGQQSQAAVLSVVDDLLQDPTTAKARRYVIWSRERVERFMRARRLVEAAEEEVVP